MGGGIKYDENNPRIAEMIIDFKDPLLELCKVWEFGADKYSKSNWKLVDNGIERYTNAMLKHLIQEEDSPVDSESHLLHASHIAFNALARLYFILKERAIKPIDYIDDFFDSNMFLYLNKDVDTTKAGDINIIDKKIERLD